MRPPSGREELVIFDLATVRSAPDERRPALRLAYAMHPSLAQGATVRRSASLYHTTTDASAAYVADTRAIFAHTVHIAREDLGLDGTDDDRLERLADHLALDGRSRASLRFAPSNARRLVPSSGRTAVLNAHQEPGSQAHRAPDCRATAANRDVSADR